MAAESVLPPTTKRSPTAVRLLQHSASIAAALLQLLNKPSIWRCRAQTSSAWSKLLKERGPWQECLDAQSLLPDHKRHLLGQQDLRLAWQSSARSTAALRGGQAVVCDLLQSHSIPLRAIRQITVSPACGALAVLTTKDLLIFTLPGQTLKWEVPIDAGSTFSGLAQAEWSPDSSMIMARHSSDLSCQLLSAEDGAVLGHCQLESRIVRSAWCPDASCVALLLGSGQVVLFRPGTSGVLGGDKPGPTAAAEHWLRRILSWAPDGQLLMHCTQHVVHLCGPTGAQLAEIRYDKEAAVGDCAWSSTSDQLAVSFLQDDAGILLYDRNAAFVRKLDLGPACARLAWAGTYLAAACNCVLRILSTAPGDFGFTLWVFPARVLYFSRPVWHISGQYIVLCLANYSIAVVHAVTGRCVWGIKMEESPEAMMTSSANWSTSGQQLFLFAHPQAKLVSF